MRRTPLKRKTPLRRGKRPRRVSANQAEAIATRRDLRAELLDERGPLCECGCGAEWTDMHERLPRARGGSPVDKRNILCLARGCHRWVHENPREAKQRGLLA